MNTSKADAISEKKAGGAELKSVKIEDNLEENSILLDDKNL